MEAELCSIQDKHKDVKLVYEKVIENIKLICKLDNKKQEEMANHSVNLNNTSEGNVNEFEISQTNMKPSGPCEEDLARQYFDYLENTKAVIEKLYLTVGKKEFESMLKDRGERIDNIQNQMQGNREKNKNTHSKKNVNENKSPVSTVLNTLQTNYEYDYTDEDLKEDDKKIREEYNAMAQDFKKIVNSLFKFFLLVINLLLYYLFTL